MAIGKFHGVYEADRADRLARDLDADARTDRRQALAGEPQAFAGEEVEDLGGADRFADRLGQGLALLAGEQRAKFFLAGENLVARLSQDRMTLEDAGARPGRKGCLCRRNRGPHVVRRTLCVETDHVIGVGGIAVFGGVAAEPIRRR